MIEIPLITSRPNSILVSRISKRWGFEIREPGTADRFVLEIKQERLQLRRHREPNSGAVCVDFLSGANAYRRTNGGGRRQAIARAVGIKKDTVPNIIDATAGLGRDAFVLASLGCRVHMIERLPVVAALLEDGLRRAMRDPRIGGWVSRRMTMACLNSCQGLQALPFAPDVVYLDPMYPDKGKSALVKKDMQILKVLAGADEDSPALLKAAINAARSRVVVKRPACAGWLDGLAPQASVKTRKHRFDLYLKRDFSEVLTKENLPVGIHWGYALKHYVCLAKGELRMALNGNTRRYGGESMGTKCREPQGPFRRRGGLPL